MKIHDAAEREAIRAKLLAFAQRNSVGVPALSLHIARSLKLTPEQVPWKTLQRFLRGEVRTNDAVVGHLARFAEGEREPDDALAELGKAMAKTMGAWQNRAALDHEFSYQNFDSGLEMEQDDAKIFCDVRWKDEGGYVRVQEKQLIYYGSKRPVSTVIREGIGITSSGNETFIVTDALQATTRTIVIRRYEQEGAFGGEAIQSGLRSIVRYAVAGPRETNARWETEEEWSDDGEDRQAAAEE